MDHEYIRVCGQDGAQPSLPPSSGTLAGLEAALEGCDAIELLGDLLEEDHLQENPCNSEKSTIKRVDGDCASLACGAGVGMPEVNAQASLPGADVLPAPDAADTTRDAVPADASKDEIHGDRLAPVPGTGMTSRKPQLDGSCGIIRDGFSYQQLLLSEADDPSQDAGGGRHEGLPPPPERANSMWLLQQHWAAQAAEGCAPLGSDVVGTQLLQGAPWDISQAPGMGGPEHVAGPVHVGSADRSQSGAGTAATGSTGMHVLPQPPANELPPQAPSSGTTPAPAATTAAEKHARRERRRQRRLQRQLLLVQQQGLGLGLDASGQLGVVAPPGFPAAAWPGISAPPAGAYMPLMLSLLTILPCPRIQRSRSRW